MTPNPEIPTPEFSIRPTPDLKDKYSAEKIESVPYVTLWEGEYTETQFEFTFGKKVFQTAPEIEAVRNGLIEFRTQGKNYSDNPKSRLVQIEAGDRLRMVFEKVNYSDFVLTNNSMEVFLPQAGKTVREILEPGPNLSPLSESLCSNHLGLSCLIITADNKLILNIGSSKKMSGASKISSSASGSMDYKEPHVTPFEVMQAELYEELGLVPSEETSDIRAIAIARELMRGGKPEMFFVMHTELTASDILSLVGSDPDKEVDKVYAVDLPEDKLGKIDKARELIDDPNNAESTKAALYYFSRYLSK